MIAPADARAESDAPLSLWLYWLGPAAVLVVGIASLAWAHAQKPPPTIFPQICGLAALAPPEEEPFLTENDAAMSQMMTKMTIRPTGDVDRDFVEIMVPHHRGAIDMAKALLRYGHNEPLRRLAQEIIVTQQQEIAAMRLAMGEPLSLAIAAPDQLSDLSVAPSQSTSRP